MVEPKGKTEVEKPTKRISTKNASMHPLTFLLEKSRREKNTTTKRIYKSGRYEWNVSRTASARVNASQGNTSSSVVKMITEF